MFLVLPTKVQANSFSLGLQSKTNMTTNLVLKSHTTSTLLNIHNMFKGVRNLSHQVAKQNTQIPGKKIKKLLQNTTKK